MPSAAKVLARAFRVVQPSPPVADSFDPLIKADPPDLEGLIDEVLKSKTHRPHFFRPSMIPGCDRANVFYYQHAPNHPQRQNPRMLRILDNGTAIHEVVQGYLGDHPEWWFAKEARVLVKVNGALVRGSCDGVMIRRKDLYRFGIEIKTMAHEGFMRLTGPTDKHVLQASIYARLQRLWWIVILYWDKDKQHLKAFPSRYNAKSWEEIKDRVGELKGFVDEKILPRYDPSTCDVDFCEFADYCASKPGGHPG